MSQRFGVKLDMRTHERVCPSALTLSEVEGGIAVFGEEADLTLCLIAFLAKEMGKRVIFIDTWGKFSCLSDVGFRRMRFGTDARINPLHGEGLMPGEYASILSDVFSQIARYSPESLSLMRDFMSFAQVAGLRTEGIYPLLEQYVNEFDEYTRRRNFAFLRATLSTMLYGYVADFFTDPSLSMKDILAHNTVLSLTDVVELHDKAFVQALIIGKLYASRRASPDLVKNVLLAIDDIGILFPRARERFPGLLERMGELKRAGASFAFASKYPTEIDESLLSLTSTIALHRCHVDLGRIGIEDMPKGTDTRRLKKNHLLMRRPFGWDLLAVERPPWLCTRMEPITPYPSEPKEEFEFIFGDKAGIAFECLKLLRGSGLGRSNVDSIASALGVNEDEAMRICNRLEQYGYIYTMVALDRFEFGLGAKGTRVLEVYGAEPLEIAFGTEAKTVRKILSFLRKTPRVKSEFTDKEVELLTRLKDKGYVDASQRLTDEGFVIVYMLTPKGEKVLEEYEK